MTDFYFWSSGNLSPFGVGPIGRKSLNAAEPNSRGVSEDTFSRALEAARKIADKPLFEIIVPIMPPGVPLPNPGDGISQPSWNGIAFLQSALNAAGSTSAHVPKAISSNTAIWRYDGALRSFLIATELKDRLEIKFHMPFTPTSVEVWDSRAGLMITSLERPSDDMAKAQARFVKTAIKYRDERRDQILSQIDGVPDFIRSECAIGTQKKAATNELMSVVSAVLDGVLHPIKHGLAVRRPEAYEHVSPMIETPQHLSFPSGHATYAMTQAMVLASVLPAELKLGVPLIKLATSIADNRVVAGVHYLMDGEGGAALGVALGLWLNSLAISDGKTKIATYQSKYSIASDKVSSDLALKSAVDKELQPVPEWSDLYKRAKLEWLTH